MSYFRKTLNQMLWAVVVLAASSTAAFSDEVICKDEQGPGSVSGEWVARYQLVNGSNNQQNLDITYLGFKEEGQVDPTPYTGSGDWVLDWNDAADTFEAISATEMLQPEKHIAAGKNARVDVPGGRCRIQFDDTNDPLQTTGEATCHDSVGPDGSAGDWVIEYDYKVVPKYGPLYKPTFVGFRPTGQQAEAWESAGQDLGITIIEISGADDRKIEGDYQAILNASADARFNPTLQTPNGHCTLQLNPYADAQQAGTRIAVVGDSLVWGYTRSIEERVALASHIETYFGWNLQVDSQGGRALLDRTRSVGGSRDEVMGLLGTQPDALVVALGTNDAISATFYPEEKEQLFADIWDYLLEILDKASQQNTCVVFVTPHVDEPSENLFYSFGGLVVPWEEHGYRENAEVIRGYMRDFAAYFNAVPVPGLQLGAMDWATIVQPNMLVWDELHLNGIGKIVHMASWIEQVQESCGL